jgi:hypothetical protein
MDSFNESATQRTQELRQLRMQHARKLFGHTVAQSAERTYHEAGAPSLGELPASITNYVMESYPEKSNITPTDLLTWGIADATRLVVPILAMHPTIDKATGLHIATHLTTIDSHAQAATIPQNESTETLYNRPGDAYRLSDHGDAIQLTTSAPYPEAGRGCPAVHFNGESMEITPIFRSFSQWAGVLAVEAYFTNKQRKNQPAVAPHHESNDEQLF